MFANFIIMSLLRGLMRTWVYGNTSIVGLILLMLVIILLLAVVNVWVQMTFFYVIKEKDIKTDAKSLLVFSWPNIFAYSWVLFLTLITVAIGFMLLIIPGVIFFTWFSFSIYVLVFEEIKGTKALQRSRELVQDYWWPVFGRIFLFGIMATIISWVPVFGVVVSIFFFTPLGVIYGYFIYQDLKQIKSVVDLSLNKDCYEN